MGRPAGSKTIRLWAILRNTVARRIESVSLLILLTVVGLRPLIGESYDSAGSPLRTPGVILTDPSPLRTLLIDLTLLLAAVGWLVARAIGPRWKYRWTGIELGAVLIAVAGAISCAVASNRRLAINATMDWLTLPVLTILLAQLARRPWQVRLAMCVVLASAAAQAAECFNQRFYGFAETARNYYEQRQELWDRQGIPLNSPQVEMFERRMAAREATGFLWHSNVTGAYLVLTAFAAAGVAMSKAAGRPVRFRRGFAVIAGLLAAGLFAATLLTGSVGAWAAVVLGALTGLLLHLARKWVARRRRAALWVGWLCVLGCTAAVVGHGLYHGSLPGASLNFRWQYWTASARMFHDHPWTGVGMENFGRHYLTYKPISSPEEIKNPHNFLVSAACDWGVIGLAGMAAMLIGGSIVLARPACGAAAPDKQEAHSPGRPFLWMLALAVGVFVPRVFLLGSDDYYYRVWMTAFPLLFWLPAFALVSLESDTWSHFSDEALGALPTIVNCGLLAFLLSDVVNFSLLVPATATTFFALLGVAVAVRTRVEPAAPVSSAGRWAPVAGGVAVVVVVAGLFLRPVAGAGFALAGARRPENVLPDRALVEQPAYLAYQEAARLDPTDPTPPAECAQFAMEFAQLAGGMEDASMQAVERIDEAIARDPCDIGLRRAKRAYRTAHAQITGEPDYYRRAVEAAAEVVKRYPTSPDDYDSLGDCYAALIATGVYTPAERTDGVRAYERALKLDASRPAWEVIRRFSSARQSEIERKRKLLERARDEHPQ